MANLPEFRTTAGQSIAVGQVATQSGYASTNTSINGSWIRAYSPRTPFFIAVEVVS